jgi:hypothetical protein
LAWRTLSAASLLGAPELLSPRRTQQFIWAFLLLGAAARVLRYLLRFPLWEDECFVCVNILERDYAGLTQPLVYCQVAPILFLWLQKAIVDLLGPSEWTFRLLGFVASMASLGLFWQLARRLLTGTALLLAVAVFSVAYPGIRYAAEAKPYGTDLLMSLVLLVLAVEWWRRPERTRYLWLLAAVAPLAIALAYPAVFIGGGVSLFCLWVLWRHGAARGWMPWLAYNALLVGSFGGCFLLATGNQDTATGPEMRSCWDHAFPPLTRPLDLAMWMVRTHTSELFAYPVGGARGASTLSFLLFAGGLWLVRRSRAWPVALLCLSPLALNFLAAAAQRYPYGGHVKLAHYLAPILCGLIGLGAAGAVALAARRAQGGTAWATRGLLGALAVLALLAGGSMGRDLTWPYKATTTARARDFARWFWFHAEYEGQAACIRTDLGLNFTPRAYRECCWTAMYLSNMYMYSPRHLRGEPLRLEEVSADRPLRCVQYREKNFEFDVAARRAWLADMCHRYDLQGVDSYPMPCFDKRDRYVQGQYYLDIYTFVPRGAVAAQADGAVPTAGALRR